MATTTKIEITAPELAMAESLLGLMMATNDLPGRHPYEFGGTYGQIKNALLECLAHSLMNAGAEPNSYEAAKTATEIYEAAISNGDSIEYQFGLLNDGTI